MTGMCANYVAYRLYLHCKAFLWFSTFCVISWCCMGCSEHEGHYSQIVVAYSTCVSCEALPLLL